MEPMLLARDTTLPFRALSMKSAAGRESSEERLRGAAPGSAPPRPAAPTRLRAIVPVRSVHLRAEGGGQRTERRSGPPPPAGRPPPPPTTPRPRPAAARPAFTFPHASSAAAPGGSAIFPPPRSREHRGGRREAQSSRPPGGTPHACGQRCGETGHKEPRTPRERKRALTASRPRAHGARNRARRSAGRAQLSEPRRFRSIPAQRAALTAPWGPAAPCRLTPGAGTRPPLFPRPGGAQLAGGPAGARLRRCCRSSHAFSTCRRNAISSAARGARCRPSLPAVFPTGGSPAAELPFLLSAPSAVGSGPRLTCLRVTSGSQSVHSTTCACCTLWLSLI